MEYAKCIIADANQVALGWAYPIAMLWIDGDPSTKGAARDITALLRKW